MDLLNKFLQWLTAMDVKKLASMLHCKQSTEFKNSKDPESNGISWLAVHLKISSKHYIKFKLL